MKLIIENNLSCLRKMTVMMAQGLYIKQFEKSSGICVRVRGNPKKLKRSRKIMFPNNRYYY